MSDIRYEIIKSLGQFSTDKSSWKKELNIISWDGNEPKYDLRSWDSNHEKMGKGITLTETEILLLKDLLNGVFASEHSDVERDSSELKYDTEGLSEGLFL